MRFLISIFLLFLVMAASGQDVIIRITGDSLHVKVVSSNDSFVYFHSIKSKKGQVEVMSRTEIAEVLYGFEEPNGKLSKISTRAKREYMLMDFWFMYGYSFMPNSEIPKDDFEEYFTDLQRGWGYNFGANYYFNNTIGLNVVFSSSKYQESIPISLSTTGVGGSVAYGNLSDKIALKYVGAGLALRYELGDGLSNFEMQTGVGVTIYSNESELVYHFDLDATGVGYHVNAKFNISLGGGLYIPIGLSFNGGFIKNISFSPSSSMPEQLSREIEGIVKNADMTSVNRFSLGAGFLFAF